MANDILNVRLTFLALAGATLIALVQMALQVLWDVVKNPILAANLLVHFYVAMLIILGAFVMKSMKRLIEGILKDLKR